MGMFQTPKTPSIPMPPPAAHPPTLGSSSVALAGALEQQRSVAAEGLGMDSTIGTSPQGLTGKMNTAPATLLGK